MARQYGSFLLRCWCLDNGEHRIKVEHVQSGECTQVTSLAAATAWINAHWDESTHQLVLPEQPQPVGGDGHG